MHRWTACFNAIQYIRYADVVAVGDNVYFFRILECDAASQRFDLFTEVFNTVSLSWKRLARGPPLTGRSQAAHRHQPFKAVLVGDKIYLLNLRRHTVYALGVSGALKWSKSRTRGNKPCLNGGWWVAAWVPGKEAVYVFGGLEPMESIGLSSRWQTCGMHKLDAATKVWSSINTAEIAIPRQISERTQAKVVGGQMLVFGPKAGAVSVFDTESHRWLDPSASVFSGLKNCNLKAYEFDSRMGLMKLDLVTFNWKKLRPKGDGPFPDMKNVRCCMVGERVVLSVRQHVAVMDPSPSLKTLCMLAVIGCDLGQSGLPHNVRRGLAAMRGSCMEVTYGLQNL